MKNEIDLRAPEFIAAARLRRCRLYLSILIAITASVALLGCYLLQLGAGAMRQENARLRAANQALAAAAVPLREMQNEIALLNARKALALELQPEKTPWSRYLRQLQAEAPAGLRVESVVLDREGVLVMHGWGSSMQQVTGYTQALNGCAFISDATVREMDLDPDRRYRFKIHAILKIGGVDGDCSG